MKESLTILISVLVYLFVGIFVPLLAIGGVFSLPQGVFWREGNPINSNDFQMEDWQTYRNDDFGFEIYFPKDVKRELNFHGKNLNTGVGVNPKSPVWKFSFRDKSYFQGTNLIDAGIIIHVLQGEEAVSNCGDPRPGSIYDKKDSEQDTLPTININGRVYWKDEVSEGAMGEFYTKDSYQTISNDACYIVTLFTHTVNIENYVGKKITSYPEKNVDVKMEQILSTFAILPSSPPFPAFEPPSKEVSSKNIVEKATTEDYLDGTDVSHWQGEIDWSRVSRAGYRFAFVKATEGRGFTDWYFFENMANGSNEGMMLGAYHFARPDLDNTGKEEAEYFLSVVGDTIEGGYLRPVLDLEASGGLGKDGLSQWVVEWMETVKSNTGVEPLIYTNYYFIREKLNQSVTDYDLWIAYWNCDPHPTADIPPTGMFADWDFWQYQAPTACGDYSIPGISGNVDLNIFNGGENELSAFEIDAPLWVSLVSDAYKAPVPYFADLLADVNGSETGPINYDLWWNCNKPGVEQDLLESVCGVLPSPGDGECLENEYGMKCVSILDENLLAEHTYQTLGDHFPKVVVSRGDETPVEDRYHIETFNPILSVEPKVAPPGYAVIDQTYELGVDVKLRTSIFGPVQLELIDSESGEVVDHQCLMVGGDVRITKSFTLAWEESDSAQKSYVIWARYRDGGDCPINDVHAHDRVLNYSVYWGIPSLSVERPPGVNISENGEDELGEQETSIKQNDVYQVSNERGTTKLVIEKISPMAKKNIDQVAVTTTMPIEILPGEKATYRLEYVVSTWGEFQFDVEISYNDPDRSPFIYSAIGDGVSPFVDVGESHWAYSSIEDIFQAGITSGCSTSPLKYCPNRGATRAELAVFIERALHGPLFTPEDVPARFQDTVGHWAQDWISALYNDGITAGCGQGNFCPDQVTTRAQMAVFLLRSKHGSEYQPPEASGLVFHDVPRDYWAADWIEQLAEEGITAGCGNDYYCPHAVVNRAQLAVFLVRALELGTP